MPTSSRRSRVADRLHSAAIHLLRRLRREDDRAGVGPAGLSALSVLVFGGERAMSALAAAERVRAPTMTRIVDALERDGLARRRPSREDARVQIVAATPAGRRVLEKARAARLDALAELLARADEADVATLERAADVLERLLADPA